MGKLSFHIAPLFVQHRRKYRENAWLVARCCRKYSWYSRSWYLDSNLQSTNGIVC